MEKMKTLRERLDSYDNQPEQDWKSRKNISVKEKGQKYSVSFSQEQLSAVYGVDGGIIKDKITLKCDKLILISLDDEEWYEVFVELKGRDIKHAIEQVAATIKNPLFKDKAVSVRQARIIGRNIPRCTGNSFTEIAKKRFISEYNCRLEIKAGPYSEVFKL